MYRDDVSKLSDLHEPERLALGGLIRVLIRLDGTFSEEEERYIQEVGDDLGSSEELWRLISQSAQELATDEAIRAQVKQVERPGARALIRGAVERIALAESIEPAEQRLIDWLDDTWGLEGDPPSE